MSEEKLVLCPVCEKPVHIDDAVISTGLVKGRIVFHADCRLEKIKENLRNR